MTELGWVDLRGAEAPLFHDMRKSKSPPSRRAGPPFIVHFPNEAAPPLRLRSGQALRDFRRVGIIRVGRKHDQTSSRLIRRRKEVCSDTRRERATAHSTPSLWSVAQGRL